ncbi:MAG: hypothetical protein WCQ23_05805 [Candidatus Methanomethylophilaceae archaeon]
MDTKKIMTMTAVAAVVLMMSTMLIPSCDAKVVEEDDVEVRACYVTVNDYVALGTIWALSYNTCVFLDGSDNEKQFIEYIADGSVEMPETDREEVVKGDNLNIYHFGNSCYDGNSVYICFEYNDQQIERYVDMGTEQKILDPLVHSFFVKAGTVITAYVTGADNISHVYLGNNYVELGKETKISITSTEIIDMRIYLNTESLWTAVSYKVDGVAEPSGVGSGADIVAVVLLVIAALIAVAVIMLRMTPKWAK